MLSKVQTNGSPGVEVILHGDRASDALGGANRPVLLEGPGTIDRGLVVASRNVEVVGATVSLDLSFVLRSAAGVVGAVGLNDVVLDERVASPAVDGQIPVAARVERTAIVDGPE